MKNKLILFKEVSDKFYQTILKSWFEIEKVVSYNPLTQSSELKSYLKNMYSYVTQYNVPPSDSVNLICNGIDQATFGNNILDKIYAAVVAFNGSGSCLNTNPAYVSDIEEEIQEGWRWRKVGSSSTLL